VSRHRHAPYAAAFEGNNTCHGVLDHPLSRMMTAVARRITNQVAKILAFMVVYIHDPS
jgi:hypothetical protein